MFPVRSTSVPDASSTLTAVTSSCVTLSPGTVVTLRVNLRRWANAPSYEEPFGAYDRLEA